MRNRGKDKDLAVTIEQLQKGIMKMAFKVGTITDQIIILSAQLERAFKAIENLAMELGEFKADLPDQVITHTKAVVGDVLEETIAIKITDALKDIFGEEDEEEEGVIEIVKEDPNCPHGSYRSRVRCGKEQSLGRPCECVCHSYDKIKDADEEGV